MMALNFQQKQKSKIFNPKTLLVGLVVLILFISVPVFANDNGRYQMTFESVENGQDYVWILDTKTGIVRICWRSSDYHTPMCSQKKDATKDGIVS